MVQAEEVEVAPEAVLLDQEKSAQQIFGPRSGYFHPFLSVSEKVTDNYYNTPSDEKSEYTTTISPGLWLAVPGTRHPLPPLTTANRSPGGLQLSRFETETERQFQAYGLYRAGIEELKNFPDDNMVTHRAEGAIQYNLHGGVALELLDVFERDHNSYDPELDRVEIDKFRSNLATALVTYTLSHKFKLRGDCSLYSLSYDEDRNDYRERDDSGFALYAFYKILPKTSIFTEYEFVDIDYDQETVSDSKEHHYFAGLDWKLTAKSRGRLKAGYGVKDFDREGADDRNDVIFEAQIDHRFTRKASMFVKLARKTREADLATAQDVLSNNFQIGYTQNLTAKLAASIKAGYIRDDYGEELADDGDTAKRSDDNYSGNLALGYALKDWLNLGAEYAYRDRDSNFETVEYQSHTLYLNIILAM